MNELLGNRADPGPPLASNVATGSLHGLSARGPSTPSSGAPLEVVNISSRLSAVAAKLGDRPALAVADRRGKGSPRTYRELSFSALEEETNRYARGLKKLGIARGMRTLLMVRPSLDFFPLAFALYRLGAVSVLIDPGIGRKNLLRAIQEVRPEAMIGVSLAHAARCLFPAAFSTVRHRVTVGRRWFWGGPTLADVRDPDGSPFPAAPTGRDELASILFTSGSTGAPKGALYTHGIFEAQTQLIGQEFQIRPGEVDLPAFPLFALFSTALGASCVIPDMDPSRPASVDPSTIVEQIRDKKVTYSFGSPAFWKPIAQFCFEQGIKLTGLRRVMIAGAPVPTALLDRLSKVLDAETEIVIPYGATEALPVSWIRGREVLDQTREATERGEGACVGRTLAGNEVRVIPISDLPIPSLEALPRLGPNEIGELIVRGPVVTRGYFGRERDDRLSKILDPADPSTFWHRMGDLGNIDQSGRIWFCGRKSQRVETKNGPMYTIRCEAIFNRHPRVYRSALCGLGAQESKSQHPVMVIECERDQVPRGAADREALKQELLELARRSTLTRSILDILFHPSFPVDTRHNAKIDRLALADWAEKQLGRRVEAEPKGRSPSVA